MSAFYDELKVAGSKREKGRNRYLFLVSIFLFIFLSLACGQGGGINVVPGPGMTKGCLKCNPGFESNPLLSEDFEGPENSYPASLFLCFSSSFLTPNPVWISPTSTSISPGKYSVAGNANGFNSFWVSSGDHTTGSGRFLICDGYSNKKTRIYCRTVPVTTGRRHIFCAWFKNLTRPAYPNHVDPTVELRINGSSIGSSLTLTENDQWMSLSRTWISNGSTAFLEIVMTSGGKYGNDLGMDDISFVECEPILPCPCGDWESPGSMTLETQNGPVEIDVECGGKYDIGDVCRGEEIVVNLKYICQPNPALKCYDNYKWSVTGPGSFSASGTIPTGPCNFSFLPVATGQYNVYNITVIPICRNMECPEDTCEFTLITNNMVDCNPCICEEWSFPVNALSYTAPPSPGQITQIPIVGCHSNTSVGHVCQCTEIKLKYDYSCVGDNCTTSSNWEITGPNNFHIGPVAGNGTLSFMPTEPGAYTITLNAVCGNHACPPCILIITVEGIVQCN